MMLVITINMMMTMVSIMMADDDYDDDKYKFLSFLGDDNTDFSVMFYFDICVIMHYY